MVRDHGDLLPAMREQLADPLDERRDLAVEKPRKLEVWSCPRLSMSPSSVQPRPDGSPVGGAKDLVAQRPRAASEHVDRELAAAAVATAGSSPGPSRG